jgi:hypothetical protein
MTNLLLPLTALFVGASTVVWTLVIVHVLK